MDGRFVVVFALMSLLLGRGALAQTPSTMPERKALAEMLFRMGRELMQQGQVKAACRKFEASQAVDPAAGTLLNLAACHEQEGRTASAWAEYNESIAAAVVNGDVERETFARTRANALEKELPRVRLAVRPEATVVGLRILHAGVAIPKDSWGGAMPVDPGPVVFRAEAPGYLSQAFGGVAARATTVEVEVPVLARAPKSAPAAVVKRQPAQHQPVQRAPQGGRVVQTEPTAGDGGWLRSAAWIGGGLGVAALAAGSYFGVKAIDKRKESDAYCPRGNACYAEGVALNEEAIVAADRSNGFMAAGVVLVGGSVTTLLLTSSGEEPASAGMKGVAARLRDGGADVSMQWAF